MIAATSVAMVYLASGLLAWIDLRRGIIPDWLNLAIAAIGLARAVLLDGWASGLSAGCEGIAVGAIVWLLRRLYYMFRNVQGLGLGDVKLLAASGIWIGLTGVPVQLLIASLTALAAACIMQLAGRAMTRLTPLPFGPPLALGLVATVSLQQGGWLG
jgi:leader peptidase (prepilin peptidase) / N-methyltransferase